MMATIEIKNCISCPFCKKGDLISTDGWDRGFEVFCTKSGEMIDGFYEHPGNEFIDKNIVKGCPLQ